VKARHRFYRIVTVIMLVAVLRPQGAGISARSAHAQAPIPFIEHTIDGSFSGACSVYATDVDGDGDVDVLGAALYANDITWWENDGSEHFTEHTIDGNFNGAHSVYATDVDSDGDMDVLGAAWLADDVTWWENDGSEHFTKHTIDGNFDGVHTVYATDVDSDGDVDVLGAALDANDVTWWENTSLSDTTPPATVTDLSATCSAYPDDIVLSWTAPGDDGNSGTASLYVVRYSTVTVSSESDWDGAFDVEGEPTPLVAGSTQTMTVSLTSEYTYYFAIRACDEAENWGGVSNSPSAGGLFIYLLVILRSE